MQGRHPWLPSPGSSPDAKKQGGAYVTAKGKVRKIDEFGGALLLVGGEKIPISAVIGIQLYNDKEQIEEG